MKKKGKGIIGGYEDLIKYCNEKEKEVTYRGI